ncbi:MAG: hypothetical protein AAF485_02785, partial [Chloroflexota bacterium]
SVMRLQSLILRIWRDESGQLKGQLSDPLREWRQPFHNSGELLALISQCLTDTSAPASDFKQNDENLLEE